MNVYFDVDEPTLLLFRKGMASGQIKRYPPGQFPVLMALQGEDGYQHKGTINFLNNQVNSATGSLSVRGEFKNPKPEKGVRLLAPGMFVRIRMPIGPHSPKAAFPNPDLKLTTRAFVLMPRRHSLRVYRPRRNSRYDCVSSPNLGSFQGRGARLMTGRKQNPPGGPRISASPSSRPDRSEAS